MSSANFDQSVSRFSENTQFQLQENKSKTPAKHNVIVLKAKTQDNTIGYRLGKGLLLALPSFLLIISCIAFTKSGGAFLTEHWDHVVNGKRIIIDSKMGNVDDAREKLPFQKPGEKGLVSLQLIKNVGAYMAVGRGEEGILVDAQCQGVIDKAIVAGYEARPCPMEGENLDSFSKVLLVKPFANVDQFNTEQLQKWIDPKVRVQQKMPIVTALHKVEDDDSVVEVSVKMTDVGKLHKVTDPGEVSVTSQTLWCTTGSVSFELDCAVAMRKGSAKEAIGTPKAMGEDAFVLDVVKIDCKGITYAIPFTATLDGGAGHTFAQYGREKLKDTFERHLITLVEQTGHINSSIIVTAMKRADDELFAKDPILGRRPFSGTAYKQLKENHQKVAKDLKVPAAEFKGVFQRFNMNPLDYNKSLPPNPPNSPHFVDIGKKKFDLADRKVAERLQGYYELATGTQEKIDVQNVMNAFFVNAEGQLECVTYNRGDCMAITSHNGTTKALSERVASTRDNRSCVQLSQGARVTALCDGVTDVLTLSELGEVNQKLNGSSVDYVTNMMKASILNGSGDDKTIVSVMVMEKKS